MLANVKSIVFAGGFILMAVGLCVAQDSGNETPSSTADTQQQYRASVSDIQSTAKQKLREKDYEGAKAVIEAGLRDYPYDFALEVSLAKTFLAEAAHAKAMKLEYKALAKRPYRMGKRMYKADPYRPDPYYIVAKAMILVGQPQRAGKTIKKALYYAKGKHPDLPLYHELLGDSWKNIRGDSRSYTRAKAAYQGALYGAGHDVVLRKRIERKLKSLDVKFGYKTD